jgi:hypothetical protein
VYDALPWATEGPWQTIDFTSTKTLSDTQTGGGCTLVGIWDNTNKICTLTMDLFINQGSAIVISDASITLDGNGYTLYGSGYQGNGVSINSAAAGVTVRNLTITGFSTGIYLEGNYHTNRFIQQSYFPK